MSANDRRAKVLAMEAMDSIALNNKCCRSTRKKHKRIASKIVRTDARKQVLEE